MTVLSHKNLEVWQRSMSLVTQIYRLTKLFPKEELYGLTSQMRRAAISIPSNIAEGRSKRSTKDYIRFVNIAYGSAAELETQLIIAMNLDYIANEQMATVSNELSEVGKMLNGLVAGLEKKLSSS
ncbi:MAG: four helix bundle protein [Alphaproteobacteria bacterium]|nr:four helix bundle protein [Alphaproteobacteria bacterium]